MAFCAQCGEPVAPQAKFCSHCGQPVAGGSASASPPVSRPQVSKASAPALDPGIRHQVSQSVFVVPQSLLADFQRCMQKHRVQPLALASGPDANMIRSRVRAELDRHRGRVRHVCIVGDWGLVPPYEIEHPIDGERSFSDAPYGGAATDVSADPMACIPAIGVARVPSRDMAVIERVLFEPLIHKTATDAFAFSVTAQRWKNASTAILSESVLKGSGLATSHASEDADPLAAPRLLLSPDWDESGLADWIQRHPLPPGSLIHFNVHGGADTPEWVGEGEWGDYQSIFEPGTIQDFSSAILFTEACFGGAMGYDEPSVVEHFFANGGHAFVGCSVPAYGDPGVKIYGVPTFGADTLALAFFHRLQQGMRLGDALCAAKMAVLTDDPPLCHPYSVKTIASFNLYGAPWHAMQKEVPLRPPTSGGTSSPAGAPSALDRIRSRMASAGTMNGQDDDDEGLLNALRASYRERVRVPLSQRTLDRQEGASRLASLVSNPEIGGLLSRQRIGLDRLRLHEVRHADQRGFLIEARPTPHPNQQLVLVVDAQGQLLQVIATKSRG